MDEHLLLKAYPQFFVTITDDASEGPFHSREEAQAYLDETEEGEEIEEWPVTLQLDQEPEGVEDVCYFTGKPPLVTLSVYDEDRHQDLPMSEEVARALYEALGKALG